MKGRLQRVFAEAVGPDRARQDEKDDQHDRQEETQHVLENAVVYDLINPQRALSTGNARLSWYIGNKRPG